MLNETLPGPYDPQRADRYARAALIPEDQFLPLADHPDTELVATFNVPLEQIDARRRDLLERLING